MTRYSDLAADLLGEAASFFVKISEGRPEMQPQMMQNSNTFRQMAELIRDDPDGALEHLSHGEMAARLLDDAANFFVSIAETNEPIREQMEQNVTIFKEIAKHLRENPGAVVPEASNDA